MIINEMTRLVNEQKLSPFDETTVKNMIRSKFVQTLDVKDKYKKMVKENKKAKISKIETMFSSIEKTHTDLEIFIKELKNEFDTLNL